ncbi:50S ribosomal protein L32 [Lentilactobacillus hilgardii]|uniref:Large ribosomal subunit protein bL32 n=1 Tax=Lentilactobacillus hilgardii (strain ATCC 8290 / DSM 20176 / CCUG 30140 / JCM 1155 / KCTC 3500 / NBRC 15886 / NCIMB 8040 / NRRL B-1843 / 9) TaxID=1423757 RepID=C0XMB7_LENH9|nr:50S ribosomal protein L32 [Lentilactobacillus hilgardii]EEI18711.1 ribosomal protein L32 [Lentilactobacillus buchneri ATCC 11577]EEI23465.1 ribosomal protein L32 [Lentilactobacillus hilgardii DSM 20176 = ATCC 8290]MCP9332129.1 50S ribosomal protein L32 [Lentilactobacillus hilgardii]MCP9348696.1 50S ribosomal protein L32 [Lentilactobacillus hilgardii]MCP9351476.1 50S ribosomal protein L32 [Lentilactobacillus hilgardii]
MATPARRTSKARKGMRRGHIKLQTPNLSLDPRTGEYTLPHHVSLSGMYKGRKVLKNK